jgi:hypothetical protein
LQYLKTPETYGAVYAKVAEGLAAEKEAGFTPEFDEAQMKENPAEVELE